MSIHPQISVRDVSSNGRLSRLVPEIDLHNMHVYNDLMSRVLNAQDLRIRGLRRQLLENGIEPNQWNNDLYTPSLPKFELVGAHDDLRSTRSIVIGNETFVGEQKLQHIATRESSARTKSQDQGDEPTTVVHAPGRKHPRSSSSPPPSSRLRPRSAKPARVTREDASSPTRQMRSGSPSPESLPEPTMKYPSSRPHPITAIIDGSLPLSSLSGTQAVTNPPTSMLHHTVNEAVENVTEREKKRRVRKLNQQLPNESDAACYGALQNKGWDVRKAADELVLKFKQKYEQQRKWLGGP